MKGEPCVLDEHAQTVLARWLTLVLIVVESGDMESASLPDSVVRKFRDDGHPLSYGFFFIAPLEGDSWLCRVWHQAFAIHADTESPTRNRNTTQTTTMGMGKALVYMFSADLPPENFSMGDIDDMIRIWPIAQPSITWPLAKAWDDARATALSKVFYEMMLKEKGAWRAPPEPDRPMGP